MVSASSSSARADALAHLLELPLGRGARCAQPVERAPRPAALPRTGGAARSRRSSELRRRPAPRAPVDDGGEPVECEHAPARARSRRARPPVALGDVAPAAAPRPRRDGAAGTAGARRARGPDLEVGAQRADARPLAPRAARGPRCMARACSTSASSSASSAGRTCLELGRRALRSACQPTPRARRGASAAPRPRSGLALARPRTRCRARRRPR